jgi:hypothetical protein
MSQQKERGFRQPGGCPVWQEANGVAQASKDLVRRMRRLRKAMLACRTCPQQTNCDFQLLINASIDAAIAEVTEEWGLGSN